MNGLAAALALLPAMGAGIMMAESTAIYAFVVALLLFTKA